MRKPLKERNRIRRANRAPSRRPFTKATDLQALNQKRIDDLVVKCSGNNCISLIVGGTEAAWSERQGLWILHVHFLAIGVPDEAWGRLRIALRKSGPAFPLKRQALNDVERQLSQSSEIRRLSPPGSFTGSGRSKAIPLPPERLAELARWWSKYTFDDFPFLFGARRRGGRIEKLTNAARGEGQTARDNSKQMASPGTWQGLGGVNQATEAQTLPKPRQDNSALSRPDRRS
jgi:hypothetical protein